MNYKFSEQLDQLGSATARLKEVLQAEPTQFNKDAAIQRFEFTVELAWKTLRSRLIEVEKLPADSPKNTIRLGTQSNLISEPETWLNYLDLRNQTSHLYNQAMADAAYNQIRTFLPLVQDLLTKLKSDS